MVRSLLSRVLPALGTGVRVLLAAIRAARWSVLAFGLALVLGLFGMGFLGLLLYFPVAPVLWLRFPGMNAWQGDWVWPAIIGVGMAWSFGFLIAGAVNHRLVRRRAPVARRRWVYLGILWLWDLVVWFLVLTFRPV